MPRSYIIEEKRSFGVGITSSPRHVRLMRQSFDTSRESSITDQLFTPNLTEMAEHNDKKFSEIRNSMPAQLTIAL